MASNASDAENYLQKFLDFSGGQNLVESIANQNFFKPCKTKKKSKLQKNSVQEEPMSDTQSAKFDYERFYIICNDFVNVIDELKMDVNSEQVYRKLIYVQELINKKLAAVNPNIFDQSTEFNSSLRSLSSSLAGSTRSLCSLKSESQNNKLIKKKFSEFLVNVNCPFCSETQADKIILVEHLEKSCWTKQPKVFEKETGVAYSCIQILPNNVMKCNICPNSNMNNIKSYFYHLYSLQHQKNYDELSKKKKFSDSLFCSCCKVLVANNYIQIDFHVNHEIHKINGDNTINTDKLLNKGVCCVYLKKKKFKCLHCQCSFLSSKEILTHLENVNHLKKFKTKFPNMEINKTQFQCEFCCKKYHIYEIINHLNSVEHQEKEKFSLNTFELCFYCGSKLDDLMKLCFHMKFKCEAINNIRKQHLKPKASLKRSNIENEKKENKNVQSVRSILVKGNNDFDDPKLMKFFGKFGEISEMKRLDPRNLSVSFRESSTIDDILLVQDELELNGIQIEILSRDEEPCNYEEKQEDGNFCDVDASSNRSSSVEDKEDEKFSDLETAEAHLQNLFQKVSSHLVKSVQRLDPAIEKKIISDCAKVLGLSECRLVGFSECGLSHEVEDVELYCDIENTFPNAKSTFVLPENLSSFINKIIKKSYSKIFCSSLWDDVSFFLINDFGSITCTHNESQKACTLFFDSFVKILTDMLSDCLKKNHMVRSFCLMMRFWLSVKQSSLKNFPYLLMALFIFFLISENIVTISFKEYANIKILSLHEAVKKNLTEKRDYKKVEFSSVKELYQKFLGFLNSFDFENYAICLPIDCPVPKKLLEGVLHQYFYSSKTIDQWMSSPMCIPDPSLIRNLASNFSHQDKKSLSLIINNSI